MNISTRSAGHGGGTTARESLRESTGGHHERSGTREVREEA